MGEHAFMILFDRLTVRTLVRDHMEGRQNRRLFIWSLLNFEWWLRNFIDKMIPHSKPWITDDDRKAIEIVLKTGMISQGEEVKRFERMCAQYLGSAHAVATASGTAALVLALRALELEKGAEVVVPTYVCKSVKAKRS